MSRAEVTLIPLTEDGEGPDEMFRFIKRMV